MTITDLHPQTALPPVIPIRPRGRGVVLHGIPWDLYEHVLEAIANQHVFINYDNGEMELMAPMPAHERWKWLLGRLVGCLATELNVPIAGLGSTTWRKAAVAKGIEPDECFYIQHEPDVRGKLDIDLSRDPVPDLAIEIDITSSVLDRLAIYAAIGIPEIWRYDGARLEFLGLQDGKYVLMARSAAFPFLSPADLQQVLDEWGKTDDTSFFRHFSAWVRERFGPR